MTHTTSTGGTMKLTIRTRIPSPRKEETPAQALRRRLIARTSTAELRRRLAKVRS